MDKEKRTKNRKMIGDFSPDMQMMVDSMSEREWSAFFQSKFFIPISAFGSPRLERYIQQFGESPLMTRLKNFLDIRRANQEYRNVSEFGEGEE